MVQQWDGFDVLSRSSGDGDGGDGDGRKWKWWKLEPRSSPVPLEQAAFVLQTLGLRINIQTQFSFIDANAATLLSAPSLAYQIQLILDILSNIILDLTSF